jgi:glyoxylase-like metal-dependent hydrolase (beta-lactamase superfamily II)
MVTQRRVWSVLGNAQRLDGGAMFGNAPRVVWERWAPADASHRIELACRALLIEEIGPRPRKILLETGIGAFFPPEMRARYGVVEGGHVLLDNLARVGVTHEDVDVVVLSHLHFDHAGGLLAPWREGAAPELLFPNATFVVSEAAWQRAIRPHARDRASFVPELQPLLEASGRLERVPDGATSQALGEDYALHRSDGHTPGLMLVEVPGASPIVFAADLIPGRAWVHLPITMGYDRFPERLIDEKSELLASLVARGASLFFTHDPECAVARVTVDGKGRYGTADARAELVAFAP